MVRAIEIADTFSKAEMVAKLKERLKTASEMEQRQATSSLKKKTSADAARTTGTEKSDFLIISNDQRKEQEKKKFKQEPKDQDQDAEEDSKEESENRLDIKA